MLELETLIDLNKLEKGGRTNRIEDHIKEKSYANLKEFLDLFC